MESKRLEVRVGLFGCTICYRALQPSRVLRSLSVTTKDHKLIFICGLHRSGTSPLFRILREHPEISGFRDTGVPEDEGQHLQTVFPSAIAYGGPGRFGFAPEAHLTERSSLLTSGNRQRLFDEWSKYWDLSKAYLLEKSPPNLIRTRFLQALFPQSYFIALYRHPVATSLATQKWSSSSLESLLEHWVHCHQRFEQDRPHLQRVLVLKYEDLIRETELEMNKIYQFLNLVPHPSLPLNPAGNEPYFDTWRHFLDEREGRERVAKIISTFERSMPTFGYSLLNPNLADSVASAEPDSRSVNLY